MATEASPRPSDAPSQLGVYTVERRLGRGGMATVYLGKDPEGRTVALKVMLPQLAFEPSFLERFVREVDATRRLSHRNVVQVLGAGEQDGLPYMVCEYVEGGTLETLLEECPKLAAPLALEIGAQLFEGLCAAHAEGIVHRDLKPANLLLTTGGALKIADFGVAKVAGASSLTRTGALFGTPAYMSPEQTQGVHVDHRSDLFSAGVILYELLTGINPHKTEDPSAALLRVQLGVPPIAEVEPTITPEVEAAIEKLLEREPEARFQTAAEALAAFQPLVEEMRHQHTALLVEAVLDPVGLSRRLRAEQAEAFRGKARQMIAESSFLPAALWLHRATLLDPQNEGAQKLLAQLGQRERLSFGPSTNPRIPELEAQVAKAPDNVKVLLPLAQLHRLEGNLPKAVACLKRVLRLRPGDAYVAAQLSQMTGERFLARPSSSNLAQGIDTGGHLAARRALPIAEGAKPVPLPMPASLTAPTQPPTPPASPVGQAGSAAVTDPAQLGGSSGRTAPPFLLSPPKPLKASAPAPELSRPRTAPIELRIFWRAHGRKLATAAAVIAVLGWAVQRVGAMIQRASDETESASAALRAGMAAPVATNSQERALEARLTAGMLAADRQLEAARDAYAKGDFIGAIEACDTLLERYPMLPPATEASFLRGKAYLAAGRPTEAREALARFAGAHPGHKLVGEALLLRGAASLGQGDAISALVPLDELLRSQPDSPFALEGRLLRGKALAAKGDRLSAEADLKHVLDHTGPADALHVRAEDAMMKLYAKAP